MEFLLEKSGHVDREGKKEQEDGDEDEEEEADEEIINKEMGKFQFSSFPFSYDHNNQTFTLGKSTFDEGEQDPFRSRHHHHPPASAIASNFNNMEVVGLAPARRSHEFDGSTSSNGCRIWHVEREHMFDKVVTPSDVGKLNRLVIPKQYAQRFFPLDASTNGKDLLLNFEDRNGKPWRFRYSYWSSSQSYVITKGWSRFVKEKRLDAGDVVSFHRGPGESGEDRFYIDSRNRPVPPPPPNFASLRPPELVRLGRFFSSFSPPSEPVFLSTAPQDHLLFGGLSLRQQQVQVHHQFQHLQPHDSMLLQSRSRYYHQDHHLHQRVGHGHDHGSSASDQHRAMNPGPSSIGGAASHSHHDQVDCIPLAIESSMPLVHSNEAAAAPKSLRLFGVNMECSNSSPDDEFNSQ